MGREEACRRLAGASLRIIPGIGPKTAERLAAIGLHHDRRAPAGRRGGARAALRRAPRRATCSPARTSTAPTVVESESGPAKSRSNETTFDRDIADLAELEAVLARLAGELAEGLRRKEVRGRTIAIKVRLDDWTTVTRARTLPAPVNDTATITGVATELLRAYAPPRPVRLLGVRMAAFEDARGGGAGRGRPAGRPAARAAALARRREDRAVAREAEPLRRSPR